MRAAETSSAKPLTAAEQPDGATTEAPSSRDTAAARGDVDVGDSAGAAPGPASGKAGDRGGQAAAVAAAIKRAARAADLPQSAVPGGWRRAGTLQKVRLQGAPQLSCCGKMGWEEGCAVHAVTVAAPVPKHSWCTCISCPAQCRTLQCSRPGNN